MSANVLIQGNVPAVDKDLMTSYILALREAQMEAPETVYHKGKGYVLVTSCFDGEVETLIYQPRRKK